MFGNGGFEDEIYESMKKQLMSNQLEKTHGFNKLSEAVDCLNFAAKTFEQAGMIQESIEVNNILSEITQEINKK